MGPAAVSGSTIVLEENYFEASLKRNEKGQSLEEDVKTARFKVLRGQRLPLPFPLCNPFNIF